MGLGSTFGITSETNNNIQTDGLVFYVDAAYKNSYSRSGTIWYNLVSTSISGSINGATFNSAGYFDFDGANDDVAFSGVDVPTAAEDFSMECWAYSQNGSHTESGLASIGVILNYGSFDLGDGTWSALQFYQGKFGHYAYNRDLQGDTATSANTWYHVAATWDGTTRKLYLNGEPDGSDTPTAFDVGYEGGRVKLGQRFDTYSNSYFEGYLNGGKIYNKCLSASKILQNYNAQKERFGY